VIHPIIGKQLLKIALYDLEDCGDESVPVPVTYHLKRLQGVDGDPEFCLPLNRPRPAGGAVLAEMVYAQPRAAN
jgi:predicted NAD/FAD-binding protein